jgi:hypothetical protein
MFLIDTVLQQSKVKVKNVGEPESFVVKGFAIWMRSCNICLGFDRQFGKPLIKLYSCAYLVITKCQLDFLGCGYLLAYSVL